MVCVHGEADPVVEQPEVQARVVFIRGFPAQVRVRITAQVGAVVEGRQADRVDVTHAPRRQRLVGVDRLAPRLTDADAQLQLAHRRREAPEERFVARAPRDRRRGEGRPFVVHGELGRAVGSDRPGHQVLAREAVVHATQNRQQALLV